jgi:hypothetical protein
VTFIVGMKCSGGLVLAADELESDGVTKRNRQKLTSVMEPDLGWGMCWAGSGTAYTVDKFSDKLKQAVRGKDYNRAAIENDVETCLEFIRQSYSAEHRIDIVLGLFGKPKNQSDPKIEPPPEYYLYKGSSETACIAPQKDYCCAGMDVTLAAFILNNTHHFLMPVEHGKRLAVFVTALMKEYADGVGGPTDVFYYEIGENTWSPMVDSEVRDAEREIRISDFGEAVSKFWLDQPANKNLDEMTAVQLRYRSVMRDMDKFNGT